MKSIATSIHVAARSSPLSQIQVQEVLDELRRVHPEIEFETTLVESHGDKDQATSLRAMEKTNFFTKEIDELILNESCRIGIHSAKDLPHPLPEGLSVLALTKGLDPADVLVMRPKVSIETLPEGAIIATSSERRENALRELRSDFHFVDLRGIISQRLAKLDTGEVDGVIIAEAALIRLGLTHLNRVKIPGETAEGQGQLAVVGRTEDDQMRELFTCLDSRPKIPSLLYLGLDPPTWLKTEKKILHHPIICIQPTPFKDEKIKEIYHHLHEFTHLIFTSKTAVRIFFKYLKISGLDLEAINHLAIIAIGQATAKEIEKFQAMVAICATEETSEGLIEALKQIKDPSAYFLWPHSALSRRVIPDYLDQSKIRYQECILYTTVPHPAFPKPNLDLIDEIVFTSPSSIEAFLKFYRYFPPNKVYRCIGDVTQSWLNNHTELQVAPSRARA
jgi:hydroxymethylbilane synthase